MAQAVTDEATANEKTERAARAQRLMDDELLREGFDTLEKTWTEAIFATPPRDTDGRERFVQGVHVVRLMRDFLMRTMANGRVAQRDLDELAGRHGTFKA